MGTERVYQEHLPQITCLDMKYSQANYAVCQVLKPCFSQQAYFSFSICECIQKICLQLEMCTPNNAT